jgi:hypothetical protein
MSTYYYGLIRWAESTLGLFNGREARTCWTVGPSLVDKEGRDSVQI